jgi:hypothetical protein
MIIYFLLGFTLEKHVYCYGDLHYITNSFCRNVLYIKDTLEEVLNCVFLINPSYYFEYIYFLYSV